MKSIKTNPNSTIEEIYQRTETKQCELQQHKIHTLVWNRLYTRNTWSFITTTTQNIGVTWDRIRQDVAPNNGRIIQTIIENENGYPGAAP